MRQLVTVIKGLLKHLFKCKVLKKDLSLSFKTEKQLPAKVERVMTGEQVKLFFVEANKHKDASTMHMLQCLAYGGLRRGACSELMIINKMVKSFQIISFSSETARAESSVQYRSKTPLDAHCTAMPAH